MVYAERCRWYTRKGVGAICGKVITVTKVVLFKAGWYKKIDY